ncbi:hypothetical protein HK102_005888 [Quaeritorhiza haematococci]|nr:hypothetical protein HK102_005888 [Quaeritorhiza haematococci]
MAPKKIAIVGSGVSGLGAAWLLSRQPEDFSVTIYEAGSYPGGHTNTVDVPSLSDPSKTIGVDTGFIVCNPVTYPNFLRFLDALSVPLERSDMSFAISRNKGEFEWAGDNLNSVFAQRSNLLPGSGMWRMLYDIIRFHEHAHQIALEADKLQFDDEGRVKDAKGDSVSSKDFPYASMSIGEFFRLNNYSEFFYNNYVVPMTAAIWSTPADVTFDKFPFLTLVRFMRNHIMLQIGGRPKWRTVTNGSREYVKKVLENVSDVRLNTPVVSIQRPKQGEDTPVVIIDAKGNRESFDHVIMATHTDQALKILGEDATPEERKILGAIKYSKNRAVLHRDRKLMPTRRTAWSSWNYLTLSTSTSPETKSSTMCLTYWMNRLQPFISTETFGEVFVTLNPLWEPEPDKVLGTYEYEHPLYSKDTIAAQEALETVQGVRRVTYCGAWTNYGFHEDGLTSGLIAALSLGATCPFRVVLNGGYPTHRKPPAPPSWVVQWKKGAISRYEPGPPIYVPWQQKKNGGKNGKVGDEYGKGVGMTDIMMVMSALVVGVTAVVVGTVIYVAKIYS